MNGSFDVDIDGGKVAVVVEAARDRIGGDGRERTGQSRDEAGIDFESEAGSERHFAGVTKKAKAGDVGAAVDSERVHGLGGKAVKRQHGFCCGGDVIRIGEAALEGSGDDAGAESFGEYKTVPWTGVGIGAEAGGMDEARDGVAKLYGVVGDGVATQEGAFGLLHLGEASGQNGAQRFDIVFCRIAEDREGRDRFAAHGIYVAE